MRRPVFLITIDTEGDDIWSAPSAITTENARFLGRFQALAERFGFKPSYLTNYEMAIDPTFVAFAKGVEARGMGEVGMHLHAWNSPPPHDLTGADFQRMPYLIDYPTEVLREKVAFMTGLLEDTFGRKMTSHRAGRWALDGRYVRALIDNGYEIDCSVTPLVRWGRSSAASNGPVADYRRFPAEPYFVAPDAIDRAGASTLLEAPMTVVAAGPVSNLAAPDVVYNQPLAKKVVDRLLPTRWLRPKQGNARQMIALADRCVAEGREYLQFMIHSSELMPGGSPYFTTADHIEALYADLEAVFAHIVRSCDGATLTEYRRSRVEAPA